MNEDFVSYEQAVKLRECGFDEPCNSYYDKTCSNDDEYWHTTRGEVYNWNGLNSECQISAPTLWQAQKWLREVKKAVVVVAPETDMADYNDIPRDFLTGEWCYEIWVNGNTHRYGMASYPSYEQALSAGIEMTLKLIEKKGEIK